MSQLNLTQEERHYKHNTPKGEEPVKLRIIYPSEPHGTWPGTTITIRKWELVPQGSTTYRACTEEEIGEFERMLGELEKIQFTTHQTLGLVSYGPLKKS